MTRTIQTLSAILLTLAFFGSAFLGGGDGLAALVADACGQAPAKTQPRARSTARAPAPLACNANTNPAPASP